MSKPAPRNRRGPLRRPSLAARNALAELENEHNQRSDELAQKRRELPWVPVELLAYNIMFGPDYAGACPGCSNLADQLDGGLVHLNYRDVTLICISRAPFEKLRAYKERMGWQFPWASSYGSDFAFEFGFAMTEEQGGRKRGDPADDQEPPDWLREWGEMVGSDLHSGLAEGPGCIAFALEDGVVYHTYTRIAPDRDFVTPYYFQLLDRTPKGRGESLRAFRHDEYETAARS